MPEVKVKVNIVVSRLEIKAPCVKWNSGVLWWENLSKEDAIALAKVFEQAAESILHALNVE